MLREYSGLSRKEFGALFDSKEPTVYEWENGRCIPKLLKLTNISVYFGVSIDCIVSGRMLGNNKLEERLSKADDMEPPDPIKQYHAGQLIHLFHTLPEYQKERLFGYLDALCREYNK